MQKNMEERLWDFIDGRSDAQENIAIDQLLKDNAAWKAKYAELLEVNALLKSTELASPSLRFTKNVMDEITKLHIAPATRSYINKKVVWGIGFFFIALISSVVIYGISQIKSDGNSDSIFSKDLSQFDFSKLFNNGWINAFLMVNVVLALVLFDSYLSGKRKRFKM